MKILNMMLAPPPPGKRMLIYHSEANKFSHSLSIAYKHHTPKPVSFASPSTTGLYPT
jgi:hypothetical protein